MSMVRSAQGSPKIPNGNVEGPRSAWFAPGMMNRTPEASAQ
jgi:hypothetical protein